MKVALFGYGTIGKPFCEELQKSGHEVIAVFRKRGFYEDHCGEPVADKEELWSEALVQADMLGVCAPSSMNFTLEHSYIAPFLAKGKPVVTCTKGALSENFGYFKPHLDAGRLGIRAVVGGGAGLSSFVYSLRDSGITKIDAVVNGSFNFMSWYVDVGNSCEEAAEEAKVRKLVEPDAHSLVSIMNGELRDVAMKSAILWNLSGLGKSIKGSDLVVSPFTQAEVDQVFSENLRHSISITKNPGKECRVKGYSLKVGDWYILGGFSTIFDPDLFVSEEKNTAKIYTERLGVHQKIGNGAGDGPTVCSMMQDVRNLESRLNL